MHARSSRRRAAIVALAAGSTAVMGVGAALGISGGSYAPSQQGCKKADSANDREHRKPPKGCHATQVMLQDGKGHTYAEAGTDYTREGDNVHSADIAVAPDGSATPKGGVSGTGVRVHADTRYQPIPAGQCGVFDLATYAINVLTGHACKLDPTAWKAPGVPTVTPKLSTHKAKHGGAPDVTNMSVYFGADDNLDSGEHDGVDGKHGSKSSQNGPSDGGGIVLNWHPLAAAGWISTTFSQLSKGNASGVAQNPVPLFDLGSGFCADGICGATTTSRRTAYRGGGKKGSHRDAYDYDGKTWDPYGCSSGSPQDEKACHDKTHKNENAYRKDEARNVYLQPGIQIYEDPDPNGSPAAPIYPLPGAYAGSCGVTVGGGAGPHAPTSPVTNKSGQVSVSPTHC